MVGEVTLRHRLVRRLETASPNLYFIMNKKIINNIKDIEDRIDILQERSYNPELTTSEIKEINKRKKKLQKNKQKLLKKLEECRSPSKKSEQ